mmetsp:Transcript_4670/g.11771  ORF Transcript_4670/g.11771 Transcript_4670/m.11771 type:complete len:188 (-) Transcript_4670:179-742(-)
MESNSNENALSKRRPRRNIISMIMEKARNKNKTEKQSSGSTAASSGGSGDDGNNKDRSGKISRSTNRQSRKGLIAAAVELTRRSKNITGRAKRSESRSRQRSTSRSRKRSPSRSRTKQPFIKGQRAFYRSSKGIAKVTVVGIHHDAKLEVYYTIKLRDGKEKQTDANHLTPLIEKEKNGTAKKREEK